MKKQLPKRLAIIGLPGSGKSTFATKLGKLLHLPVYHLDKYMFEPEGKKRDKKEFLSMQKVVLDKESWIIEGCSFSTFEMRFARADTFIYFRFSRALCFWRIFKRLFNHNTAFGGLRIINWGIVKYIWHFDQEKKERIEELKAKYPQVNFLVFRNQNEANQYLQSLSK